MSRTEADTDVSIVGTGARIKGTFVSTGSLRIGGELKGKVSVEGDVLVSPGSVVQANIQAGSITLGGRVKGNLAAPGDISLPPESVVEGDVQARSVTAHGSVKGNVVAEDRVEIGAGGRVDGDVTCRTLVVVEGAVFCGRSNMSSG